MENRALIEKLSREHRLEYPEWVQLFSTYSEDDLRFASALARQMTVSRFGKRVWFRGIVEFTNICRNDCYYCGIRCGNRRVSRYRLEAEDIYRCCAEGYENGFRTFVLQGGEDPYFTDERLCGIVSHLRKTWPDCAVTLSVGERSRASYQALYDAGAERYLLRHETADPVHYAALHPPVQTLENRLRCLRDLKEIGYQTGCGMMIGSPEQTPECLAEDLLLLTELQPEMVGIGPFLPHRDTPFRDRERGSVQTTLLALALCRLLFPRVLLPATTALGTAEQNGRQQGVLAGCNVVMPNLSPLSVRKKYMLYDGKAGTERGPAEEIALLRQQMEEIGYEVVVGRGDWGKEEER